VTLVNRVPETMKLRESMTKFSKNLMPVFFNMIDRHHGVWDDVKTPNGGIGDGGSADRISSLQDCVRAYASISDSSLMSTLVNQVLSRLSASVLKTYEDPKHIRDVVTLLAVCDPIASHLSDVSSQKLFEILSTIVGHDKFPMLQKRAYGWGSLYLSLLMFNLSLSLSLSLPSFLSLSHQHNHAPQVQQQQNDTDLHAFEHSWIELKSDLRIEVTRRT